MTSYDFILVYMVECHLLLSICQTAMLSQRKSGFWKYYIQLRLLKNTGFTKGITNLSQSNTGKKPN